MSIYVYDGSFEGLLSAIFQVYADKAIPRDNKTLPLDDKTLPLNIVNENYLQFGLLDEIRHVTTNDEQAERVLRALGQRSDGRAAVLVYKLYLSELPQFEMTALGFIKTVMQSQQGDVLGNYANPHISETLRIDKMIGREVHRMHAFVRFQKSVEGIFHAAINPDFNILPLIGEHFVKRYADQPWVILDTLRHYALYYDLETTAFISADHPVLQHMKAGATDDQWRDGKEDLYQQLWVSYFHSVNIQERKNTKLHLRHMPKRYWPYLIEKSKPKSAALPR